MVCLFSKEEFQVDELCTYLIEHNIQIASTESFTVGTFASRIGMHPGISKVYRGSVVSYQTMIKHKVLGIDQALIDHYGVVSSEIAHDMATHGKALFDSDVCISFTGNAGPDAMEGKKVGQIYIGIAAYDDVYTFAYELSGSRQEIVDQAISLGCVNLLKVLKK
jgi:PncC family amidohydrolase